MAGEWSERPLGELIENFDGIRKPVKEADRRPGRYPYYGASGVVDYVDNYLFDGEYLLIAEDGENLRTRNTPVAFMARGKFWVNNHAHIVRGNREADTRFLMYALSASDINGYLTGSAMPKLTQANLNRIPLLTPPLLEQHAIARILGTLDEKIELNRRMSETLEAMARAVFKSWFVDFDPVRAKVEGCSTGLPEQLDQLLPASFEESELGEIPTAWAVGALGDIATHQRRGAPPHEIESDTPYIALEHMPKRSIALSEWTAANGLGSNKFRFRAREILFGKLRPYFHKVGVAPVDGVCSTDIVVVVPKSNHWFGLVLEHVSSDAFVRYTSAGSTGTKMPRTSWTEMARYPVVIPPKAVAEAFTRVVEPCVDKIIAGIHESRILATLRDTLLPKLICGELRISKAEQLVGQVA